MSIKNTIEDTSKTLKEPEWLLAWRERALERSESLPKSIKHGIGISALFPEAVPDFDGVAEYQVDASKGLEIYTWSEACTQEEFVPILEGLLGSPFFPLPKDAYRAKGNALFASGLVVYVQPTMQEDGTIFSEKFTLNSVLAKTASADIIVVIVKAGAQCDLTLNNSGGEFGSVHSRTLVVVTEQDAIARVTQRDQVALGAMVMHESRGIIAGNAKVTWRELMTDDMLVSSVTHNLLIGSGATVKVLQGLAAKGHAEFDVDVSAEHIADYTHSQILTAGTAEDSARILYRGIVTMQDGVHNVVGAQEAKFLALTPGAKIDAIPSLDIASNDVTCAHKLSISHVRDGDLFYPKLRGLSDKESRALYLEAHFANVFYGEENTDIMKDIIELHSNTYAD